MRRGLDIAREVGADHPSATRPRCGVIRCTGTGNGVGQGCDHRLMESRERGINPGRLWPRQMHEPVIRQVDVMASHRDPVAVVLRRARRGVRREVRTGPDPRLRRDVGSAGSVGDIACDLGDQRVRRVRGVRGVRANPAGDDPAYPVAEEVGQDLAGQGVTARRRPGWLHASLVRALPTSPAVTGWLDAWVAVEPWLNRASGQFAAIPGIEGVGRMRHANAVAQRLLEVPPLPQGVGGGNVVERCVV